jgi:tripartite ATP-independent transporter DctP family solute receptor
MVDRPAIGSQGRGAPARDRLDIAARITAYRDARAGGATGRCHAMTHRYQGGSMRGLVRGFAVVTLIAAVAVAAGVSSVSSQAKPTAKKLDIAYLLSPPESGATGLKFMAEEVTKRSNGAINMVFHGGTLLNKELEIMDAVKSGNVAIGSPIGAASTVFPEMGVFLTPYLVRDYQHAYAMFNGQIGKELDETFQKKYKVKVLFFFDYGFRHFWNNKRPINSPADLKGLKMRVQQGKVFADTVNGLGASAVPMPWGEVIPAAQQGVIDGADLPIVNINALKVYEISKFASMTYHNYGPTVLVMNLDIWKSLPADQQKLIMDVSMEAQKKIREATESVDSLAKAKEILEAKGMKVNQADVPSFRKLAEEKIWPQYRQQYAEMWDKIVNTK